MKTRRASDDSRSFRIPTAALTADPGFREAASLQRASKAAQDAADSGPSAPSLSVKVGPFSISGGPNTPSIDDVRNKDPKNYFNQFSLKVDSKLDAGMSLTSSPQKPSGPDPNGPNPKPQGPQCQPKLDQPDTLGCEN